MGAVLTTSGSSISMRLFNDEGRNRDGIKKLRRPAGRRSLRSKARCLLTSFRKRW